MSTQNNPYKKFDHRCIKLIMATLNDLNNKNKNEWITREVLENIIGITGAELGDMVVNLKLQGLIEIEPNRSVNFTKVRLLPEGIIWAENIEYE
jgi:hypothetical protein